MLQAQFPYRRSDRIRTCARRESRLGLDVSVPQGDFKDKKTAELFWALTFVYLR
jgi:hypothetical protein